MAQPGFAKQVTDRDILSSLGDAGDFAVLAVHFHGFADELLSFFSTFRGRSQGQSGSFAGFVFDNDFLGRCIKALQGAFVRDNFSATCVSGTKGHGADRQKCECLFHEMLISNCWVLQQMLLWT